MPFFGKSPRAPKGQLADPNIIRAVGLGKLTHNDLGKCWKIFKKWDHNKEGKITIEDLFVGILGEDRNMFADSLMELLVIKEEDSIDFGQFVLSMMTYALFETVEILKFCFFMFDKDKNGFIHKDEFILFIEMIHARDITPNTNIINTVEKLDVDGDGKFTWAEFTELHHTYPQVLFPCFRIQIAICRNILGLKWWKKKKEFLVLERLAALEKNEKVKRKQLAMLEKQRQAAIRRDMGFVDFYLQPMQRHYFDMKYPPTTADQLVQLDETSMKDKMSRLAGGLGSVEFEEAQANPGITEDDEKLIVDEYKLIDQNMAEVGAALREGRRIKYSSESVKKKGKKKKGFGAKKYHNKIMDVAHGVVDPHGAVTDIK
mmetsp:Transcript_14254/g.16971  ORF Transcript_14254/g.16971 Transcript_14254/m.16971 type:complete len:373 (-) Transcript_14254:102-1220(-)